MQIARPEDIAGVERVGGYIAAEAEVAVGLSASEFAARASMQVPVSVARSALEQMGIHLPRSIGIDDLSPLLRETPKLTPVQIEEFIDRVGTHGN
ncbi:hypothetical protein [Nocardia sp. MW-W600-9]